MYIHTYIVPCESFSFAKWHVTLVFKADYLGLDNIREFIFGEN